MHHTINTIHVVCMHVYVCIYGRMYREPMYHIILDHTNREYKTQRGAWWGPKPVKIAIFEAIKKNEKSKKSLQNWMESQGGCTRVLSK